MAAVTPRVLLNCIISIVFLAVGSQHGLCLTEHRPDLPNFGQVTETLYRGGQPTSNGFAKLQSMGVGVIINFRDDRPEKGQVEALGMKYVGIPWNAHHEPSSADVARFLETILAHPKTKIFVHCQRGADRTGLMVAAYRVAVEHRKVAAAIGEMNQFHFSGFWHPQLTRYLKSLPYLLQNEGALKSVTSAQTTPGSAF
jgi:protein tyrosine/serine phosphatase